MSIRFLKEVKFEQVLILEGRRFHRSEYLIVMKLCRSAVLCLVISSVLSLFLILYEYEEERENWLFSLCIKLLSILNTNVRFSFKRLNHRGSILGCEHRSL